MGTNKRRELSKKNKYYIPKERRYELEHFCKQYPDWLEELKNLNYILSATVREKVAGGLTINNVEIQAMRLASIKHRIDIVNKAALDADKDLSSYILEAVTEGKSYVYFQMNSDIPAGKDMFWDREKRFYWLLDKYRD